MRDVRIITDNKTRRSKGICYVEFADVESVPLAMGLSGQRLLGVPIIVQVKLRCHHACHITMVWRHFQFDQPRLKYK